MIVGLNSEDGTVYAHISFFFTLNFAILLGTVPLDTSRAIITTSIRSPNPLQRHRHLDRRSSRGRGGRPDTLSASLAEAIRTGRAEAQIGELMCRISDFVRRSAAADIMRQIAGAAALPNAERDALFADIVSAEAQRVLDLMCYVAKDLKRRASNAVENAMATFMEQATTLDPATENGLSEEASRSLAVACEALAKQMSEDCKAGKSVVAQARR